MTIAVRCGVPLALVAASFALAGLPTRAATPAGVPETTPAMSEHLKALATKVPAGFAVIPLTAFTVVGDEPPAHVRQRAEQTVRWAVERLKRQYFPKDPAEIIDIWLFRDGASYTNHAKSVFGDRPTTPFGYYSTEHRALIMNIATGGGTLVHELVHPFMRANFPACPAWYNEGLASLYEQSSEREGRIVGLTNWRLPILQQGIRDGATLPFERLMAMDDDAFYGRSDERSYNQHYPQARYLCFYLQERGLLERFHREFVAGAAKDPSGYATLRRVLGDPDMTAFQAQWERFVMDLRFP